MQIICPVYHPSLESIKFPRLFGMQIGSKHYQDSTYIREIGKLDIAIMGFYKGWSNEGMNMRQVLSKIKEINPNILLGQYTILNETNDDAKNLADSDIRDIIYKNNWWLKILMTKKYNGQLILVHGK